MGRASALVFYFFRFMSSLIVSLPFATAAQAGLELPYALVSDSAMLVDAGAAPVAKWPKASELVLQVPAQALSWFQLDLPKPGRSLAAGKLRAVLEGLAEEQVLGEVASLHLALPAQAPGGEKTWVAACDKAWLADWLHLLEAQGRPASRIVPQAEPQAQAQLHIAGQAETASFIASGPQGVLTAPLSHARALLGDLGELDGETPITAEPAVVELAQALRAGGVGGTGGAGAPVQILQSQQHLAQALGSAWNLGQFDLATSGSGRAWQKLQRQLRQLCFAPEWQALRWGLLLLLAAQLLGLNVWAWQERQALALQQKQLRATVSQITGASYVTDTPLQQARAKVQALRQATGTLAAEDLEPMLALLAAGLPPMPAGSELVYEEQSLRLRAPALGADALQKLRSAAAAAGYQVLTVDDTLMISPATGNTAPAAVSPQLNQSNQPNPADQPGQASPPADAQPAAVVSSLNIALQA